MTGLGPEPVYNALTEAEAVKLPYVKTEGRKLDPLRSKRDARGIFVSLITSSRYSLLSPKIPSVSAQYFAEMVFTICLTLF
jgi:hypothetical protein